MLINLETPTGSNFLKDFPTQNAVNCDRIDDYAGPCLTTSPILDYVPVLTATTTNPNLGTGGTLVGKYYTVFDQVYTWGEFRFGTSASVGSGVYRISLPFAAKTLLGSGASYSPTIPVGNGTAFQVALDANRQPLVTVLSGPSTISFLVKMGTGGISRGVSHNIPFAWSGATPGDGVFWSAKYQREA